MYTFRSLAGKFGVSKAVAWRSVHQVVRTIYRYRNSFIVWPTAEEALNTANHIQGVFQYPGIIGFVDGTEIEISAPSDHPEAWFNRKKFPSMKLQVRFILHLQTYTLRKQKSGHLSYF